MKYLLIVLILSLLTLSHAQDSINNWPSTPAPTSKPTTPVGGWDGDDGGKHGGGTDIKIGSFTINVGKIKVDINKCEKKCDSHGSYPGGGSIIEPLGNDTTIWPDTDVSTQPGNDEVVLGESDVSTQGLPGIGIGIVTGPVIYSFTYKIQNEKKVRVDNLPLKRVVTFIIRGKGFDISSALGVDAENFIGDNSGIGSLLEPRVFLGAIPLKVVKFTDTYIEARFEDIDDQKSFKPGSYLVRVKVLHVEKKGLGILSTGGASDISTLGGLSLPELGVIGQGLPQIKSPIDSSLSLVSLFAGLQFDSTSLLVTFPQADADKIAKCARVPE